MITGKIIEVYKVGGYNADSIYNRFNELTGLSLKFEIDQSYGTDCYDVLRFSASQYHTLEELEFKNKKYKKENFLLEEEEDDVLYSDYDDEYITLHEIIDYLRRKGELPEMDILFEVYY